MQMSNVDRENRAAEDREDEEDRVEEAAVNEEASGPDVDDLSTDELLALSRAAESRVNVFNQLAQMNPDRHGAALEAANADFRKYADALKEHNYDPTGAVIDPSLTVIDKEGTAPTMADATGTFAADAETANMGGIGINDSNADPQGALEKLNERAGRDDMTDSPGTSSLMGRDTTLRARRERGEGKGRRERVPLLKEPA